MTTPKTSRREDPGGAGEGGADAEGRAGAGGRARTEVPSADYATVLGPRQVIGGFALIAALLLVLRGLLQRRRGHR